MSKTGWIKLQREYAQWQWFTCVNVAHLFTYLLLTVNHKESCWMGTIVKPGQTITSYQQLANATGLSVQNVRTALKKLVRTGDITVETTNKFSLVSVVEWEKYQEKEDNSPLQNSGQKAND